MLKTYFGHWALVSLERKQASTTRPYPRGYDAVGDCLFLFQKIYQI